VSIQDAQDHTGTPPGLPRNDQRIQAHVFLCLPALLLVRIAEKKTGRTWDQIRSIMERVHMGEFISKNRRVLQCTELTHDQVNILKLLKIPAPPKIKHIQLNP
jgi:transposase